MPIYDIQIKTPGGRNVGAKIVSAPCAAYIRSHKSKYVGSDRRIGAIVLTRYKSTKSAMRTIRWAENVMRRRSSVFGFAPIDF